MAAAASRGWHRADAPSSRDADRLRPEAALELRPACVPSDHRRFRSRCALKAATRRELLDELKSAAKAIGNDELYAKFGDACDLVQRDIIFVNSLYTA